MVVTTIREEMREEDYSGRLVSIYASERSCSRIAWLRPYRGHPEVGNLSGSVIMFGWMPTADCSQ